MGAVTIMFASLFGSPPWVIVMAITQSYRRIEFELAMRWWVSKASCHRGGEV